MADDGSTQNAIWPLPSFSFQVTWGTQTKIPFQEVSGLDTETQILEYRHSNSPAYSTIKMPGIKKFGNVTLKKGIFKDDKKLWEMYNKIKMNTFERQTVVISLLDESNGVAMSWNLVNAFPAKMSVTDLKSDANEPAVETIELAHEGFNIAK